MFIISQVHGLAIQDEQRLVLGLSLSGLTLRYWPMLQSSQGWLGKDSLLSLLMSLLAVDQKSLTDPFHVHLCRGQFSARHLVSSEQASWEEKQRKKKQDVSHSRVLYNSVWEVTSCASCSILFIRGRSLVQPTLKGRGLHKGIWIPGVYQMYTGVPGSHARSCWLHEGMRRYLMTTHLYHFLLYSPHQK